MIKDDGYIIFQLHSTLWYKQKDNVPTIENIEPSTNNVTVCYLYAYIEEHDYVP